MTGVAMRRPTPLTERPHRKEGPWLRTSFWKQCLRSVGTWAGQMAAWFNSLALTEAKTPETMFPFLPPRSTRHARRIDFALHNSFR
jgi:hypothetical protein